jgi:uncharacterized membrane protein YuzA (DUF378 family)
MLQVLIYKYKKMQEKILHMVAFGLVIVGSLNWLLVAILGYDISNWLGGQTGTVAKVIYVLVGASAVYLVATHKRDCRGCETKM